MYGYVVVERVMSNVHYDEENEIRTTRKVTQHARTRQNYEITESYFVMLFPNHPITSHYYILMSRWFCCSAYMFSMSITWFNKNHEPSIQQRQNSVILTRKQVKNICTYYLRPHKNAI